MIKGVGKFLSRGLLHGRSADEEPSPLTIKNPVLPGFNADPSICKANGSYYIATSTFEWYPGVQIHASTNLAEWWLAARPLDRMEQLDMRGNPDSCGIWAPCLSYADGLFWLIYTDVKRLDGNYKDTHNYLVTAPAIEGPWSDPIYMNSSGFDPSLFHDDDGRKWFMNMRWNHRSPGTGGNPAHPSFDGILLQEYDHSSKALTGPIKNIFDGSTLGLTEAPHLHRRGAYYYLITAEGGTGYNHAVTHARSKSLWGPYEIHPSVHPLTAKDTPATPLARVGHGQFVDVDDDRVVHTFLCSRPLKGNYSPCGRETGITFLRWNDQGWLESDDGPAPAFYPDGGARDNSEKTSYDFDTVLPDDFQWLRTPEPERIFQMDGCLRLIGRESIGSWFEQSLVARRQTHLKYSAETVMEFAPDSYQQMAGLVTYYNRHKFHYLCVSVNDDGERVLYVQSCPGNWPDGVLEFPVGEGVAIPDGPISLGVDVERAHQQFRYKTDGDWMPIGPVLNAAVLSDEGGRGEHASFTGNFVGMACQDVSGRTKTADFAHFLYSGEDVAAR